MQKPPALLFDLNGTMIDDMQYHISAWHRLSNSLGASISMENMTKECYGKGEELLERIFPGRFADEEKKVMILEKETAYQTVFRPHLKLIEGLPEFLEKAYNRDVKMAIGSAANIYNIDFVLDGLNIRHYIDAIVSADDVEISKPAPETFLKCADLLGEDPANCIVFEDSAKGVESAANAGMPCVVLTTMHTKEEFGQYSNVICIIENYTDPRLEALF
ncbi:MAG: HAD family phosphatase [Ferruginibacter sp.]